MEGAPGSAEAGEGGGGGRGDRFTEFRKVMVEGLGAHGDEGLRLLSPSPGERVIDLGCGFGDTTQQIAGMVGPGGEAFGVDASARFVETASRDFDAACSRMGTMFFANPVVAMRNVGQALRPGGRLCLVVWRAKSENPYFYRAEEIASRWLTHPDQTDEPTCRPGPFSMSNADTTSGILKSAGFEGISLTRCDKPILLGVSLDEAVAMVTSIGPAGELIRVNEERGAEVRPEIEAAISEEFARQATDDGVWGEASTWLVSARVPSD